MKRELPECVSCAWYVPPENGNDAGCEKIEELSGSLYHYLMGGAYAKRPRHGCPFHFPKKFRSVEA